MKKHLTIRLDEELIKELKMYCLQNDTTITELVKICFSKVLNNEYQKEIAKTPTIRISAGGFDTTQCRVCGCDIDLGLTDKSNYCHKCGTKIDWSKYKERGMK